MIRTTYYFGFTVVLLLLSVSASAFSDEKNNGGDPDESVFIDVATNIAGWIQSDNANEIHLPKSVSLEAYKQKMLAGLANYNVSFTRDKVMVDGVQKTCKNFKDVINRSQIICNSQSFELAYKNNFNDIYRLVHHEFAGLAELEVNHGQKSDYSISDQISGYLQVEQVKRLPIVNLFGNVDGFTSVVPLATAGTIDWVHWGDRSAGPTRKSSDGSLISDITLVNGPASYYDDARTFSWSDGDLVTSGSDSAGVYSSAPGAGYIFSVPADTHERTLTLYLATYLSTGTFTAWLSDGSAPTYTTVVTNSADSANATITLTYTAASAGQTLNLQWTMTSIFSTSSNIAVAAATLATTGRLETGTLTGKNVTSCLPANLTVQGSTDWIHWSSDVLRKSGGGHQISDLRSTGSTDYLNLSLYKTDFRKMSWTGGSPTASATNSATGVFMTNFGSGSGFIVTVPAGSIQRTLRLYVGGHNSGGTVTARLSDGSIGSYVDVVPLTLGNYDRSYNISYRSRSPSATLSVSWLMTAGTYNTTGGYITISGAALHE